MPEIEIRPAIATDIPDLIRIDHSYTSEYFWQMDLHQESDHFGAAFREMRMPRAVRVDYPRSPQALAEDWLQRPGVLVALLAGEPVGYAGLMENIFPQTSSMTDLVVTQRLRRQGIGSALTLAALEWVVSRGTTRRLMLEMQPKNQAAIHLAQKLGFDYCGYVDHYYVNHDISIFFAKWIS